MLINRSKMLIYLKDGAVVIENLTLAGVSIIGDGDEDGRGKRY